MEVAALHAYLVELKKQIDNLRVLLASIEGFEKRKQLAWLLVESISLGKSQQEGRAEVQITYRFGPPPDSASEEDLSMSVVKNGRGSITPGTNIPTLTVVALR